MLNNYKENPTFFVASALLQTFLEVAAQAGLFSGAVESYPEVVVLTLLSLQAAGPCPGVVVLMAEPFPEAVEPAAGPCPEVESFPEAQLFPEVVVLTLLSLQAAGPCPGVVVLMAEPFPEAAFVAVASLACVAELQASGNIHALSASSVPVSELAAEIYSPGHPILLAFPSIDYYASSASSAADIGNESVYGSTDGHTNYGPCNVLSIVGLHHNKNSGHYCNTPIPGHNSASDTSDLPMDATTIHSRKIDLQKSRGQRKHWVYLGAQSHPVVQQIRGAVDWMYHTKRWEQDQKQYQVPGAVDFGQVQRAVE